MKQILIGIFLLLLSLSPVLAETEAEFASYLKTGSDDQQIRALEYFGKETKNKSKSGEIQRLLSETKSVGVASRAATALGYFGERGEAVTALKSKIENNSDPLVVYSCLVALYNIQSKAEAPDSDIIEAFRYADQNRRQDEVLSNFLSKLKSKYKI